MFCRCQAKCHSDSMHQVVVCTKPCERQHVGCGHLCGKDTCGEDCGQCDVKVDGVLFPCGHFHNQVLCHKAQQPGSLPCSTTVEKDVPGCEHTVEVKCSVDTNSAEFSCTAPCEQILSCGHVCPGFCGSCNPKRQDCQQITAHEKCNRPCGRAFGTCNHRCLDLCHNGTACKPCGSDCEVGFFRSS